MVPCLPYADTRREAGGWYAVVAVRSIDDGPGEPGPPVHCVPLRRDGSSAAPAVVARVNASPRFIPELIEALQDSWSKYVTREGIRNLPEAPGHSDDASDET